MHILVVDDESEVRAVLREALERDDIVVEEAADLASALQCLEDHAIDLVTLDLGLGREDGLEAARLIRNKQNIPIVMVTARDALWDRIAGLEHGADDYITKPFHIREVVLRIRNVLRRYSSIPSSEHSQKIVFDGCVIDPTKRELRSFGGGVVGLTDIEFRLLQCLASNAGRVLSRDEISNALLGHEWSPLDRTIDGHIARLRRKLETSADEPRLIKSVRGVGYVFTGDVRLLGPSGPLLSQ
ncbi:response regulator transcription factor [Bradyrhizobium sp. HKCCYLS2038]|uniref:response regulator transcription factor n=1 Tax=unclassified Bradyrhizobium TaxID=2631580 RepID=UPI003EBED52C